MANDKAIEHGKEKRKPYTKAKRIVYACRNHGTCSWCTSNRTFFDRKKRIAADLDLKESLEVED